jgi:hypothetical protein
MFGSDVPPYKFLKGTRHSTVRNNLGGGKGHFYRQFCPLLVDETARFSSVHFLIKRPEHGAAFPTQFLLKPHM